MVFFSSDGHSGWANSKALELAGITADTPDPAVGGYGRDADGKPTGYIHEVPAMLPVINALNLLQPEVYGSSLQRLLDQFAAMGFTSVFAAAMPFGQEAIVRGRHPQDHWGWRDRKPSGGIATRLASMCIQPKLTLAHVQIAADADQARLARLKPLITSTGIWAIRYAAVEQIIGRERYERMVRFGRLQRDHGLNVALGSDWPATDASGTMGIVAITGSIREGKRADLCVLDHDLTAIPTDRVHSTRCLLTLMDGVLRHDARKLSKDA